MKKKTLLFTTIFLLCLLSLVLTVLILFPSLGYKDLVAARERASLGDMEGVLSLSESAEKKFLIGRAALSILDPIFAVVGKKEEARDLSMFLASGTEMAKGTMRMGSAGATLKDVFFTITSGEGYQEAKLKAAVSDLAEAKTRFSTVKTNISSLSKKSTLLTGYNFEGIDRELTVAIQEIDKAKALSDVFPRIVPPKGEKTYLLVFQNNMELRPTGGFIGSFAILTFADARIHTFTIYDVYDADGQLKGHVEPPMPIRKYLPQVNWFLRDANFDPDFSQSSTQVAWFLEKELGVSIDGVIAADVGLAKLILDSVGEVYVTDYKDTVTAANLFEKTQLHIEENFFAGSREKKNFLGALTKGILEKVGDKGFLNTSFVNAIQRGMSEKHLLFAFFDPSIQSVIKTNNWGGELAFTKARGVTNQAEGAIDDYLAIREANLGVNKANAFIARNVAQRMHVTDNQLQGEIKIVYVNTSEKESKIEGTYKNYLRFYLPKNAIFTEISFDGRNADVVAAEHDPLVYEKKNFAGKVAGKLEVEQRNEGDFSLIGFLVQIPPKSQKTVTVSYTIPATFPIGSEVSYRLHVSKQPGTEEDPYTLTITHPDSFLVTPNTSFSTQLSVDRDFTANIVRIK